LTRLTFAQIFFMLLSNLTGKKIILASKSPRRQELLKGLDLDFEIRTKDIDEDFPDDLRAEEIPMYLCKLKADAFLPELKVHEILITADTVVWVNGHVLNKPMDRPEAESMLAELSGTTHFVYTAIAITSTDKQLVFFDETEVEFVELEKKEMDYYLDHYKPYDKAGAYGVQELIGYIGISRLHGSYFNVMGLPIQLLYKNLKTF
jgi:septum formation protein